MLGAGTIINPILKIVTTVAILAAVYFFILRPILDTTENTINTFSPTIEKAQEQVDRALSQAEQQAPGSQSFNYTVTGPPKQVRRIVDCIQRAGGDVARIQACTQR